MGEDRCFKCDRLLFPGKPRYIVTIRIIADKDKEGESPLYVDRGFRSIFRSSDADDALLPDENGNSEMTFTLCATCRRDFADNPLALDFSGMRRPAYLH